MNFPALGAALLWVGFICSSSALEPLPAPKNQISVELAPPPLEGTVSIGVFDSAGKCIRVLAKGVDQESIPSALNGFQIIWDGKNEAGGIAVNGDY